MPEFKPGDVVEIRTDAGLRYAVVTHDHPSYPTVVQVMAGAYQTRPDNLAGIVEGKAAFTAMVPLRGVLSKLDLVHEVAGTVDLGATSARFPTFRMPIRDKQGEIVYWWFWDGRGLSYEVDPGTERDALPLREVMSAGRFRDHLTESA